MTSGRKIQFHNPRPSWARRTRAFGQDDGADYVDTSSSDAPPEGPTGDTSTLLSPIEVTAAAPSTPVDVTPQPSLLGPDITLSAPASLDLGPLTTDLPNITLPGGASNPLNQILSKLFPAKPKAGGGGGAGAGVPAPPKLQPSTPLKPSTATSSTGINPMVLWGAGAAGLVLLAALLSGHHDRRAGARR